MMSFPCAAHCQSRVGRHVAMLWSLENKIAYTANAAGVDSVLYLTQVGLTFLRQGVHLIPPRAVRPGTSYVHSPRNECLLQEKARPSAYLPSSDSRKWMFCRCNGHSLPLLVLWSISSAGARVRWLPKAIGHCTAASKCPGTRTFTRRHSRLPRTLSHFDPSLLLPPPWSSPWNEFEPVVGIDLFLSHPHTQTSLGLWIPFSRSH
ncbi:hypothetical protein F4780DRAFT_242825 [Xylariomycetidae sp. FL0641]|nr:hypothetical protein F4780DRAFT_242825 [Xylariomycetidae sp. FL0641]